MALLIAKLVKLSVVKIDKLNWLKMCPVILGFFDRQPTSQQ